MDNAIIKKDGASVPSTEVKTWGAAENLDARDLLVTKLYHQQQISKHTAAGKAQAGDWIDSVTGEVLCKKDQPLELIIFSSYKNLQTFKKIGDKFKWDSTERLTPENAGFEYEFSTGIDQFRRRIQYNYFCLLVNRLHDLPYVLSLSSTKTPAAKKLNTFFKKLERINLPSASKVFVLTGVPEKNDQGSWIGIEVDQGRVATQEEQDIAYSWYKKIKTANVIVSDEEDELHDVTGSVEEGSENF